MAPRLAPRILGHVSQISTPLHKAPQRPRPTTYSGGAIRPFVPVKGITVPVNRANPTSPAGTDPGNFSILVALGGARR